MKKIFLALMLIASFAKAEIPAKRWVGHWVNEKNSKEEIILRKDYSCKFVIDTKIIEGVYGIDAIEGFFTVVTKDGKAHIFAMMLFDDSHDFTNPHKLANGLWFYGNSFTYEYDTYKQKQSVETKVFRRK